MNSTDPMSKKGNFYSQTMEQAFRFGDVIQGFVLSNSKLVGPILKMSASEYQINVSFPEYAVVLSPCCSIGKSILSLTPLSKVLPSFFDNPFFCEDLTRINEQVEPQQSVSPELWEQLPQDRKQKLIGAGRGYTLLDLFVYEEHDLLPLYVVDRKGGNIDTRYHMIDFRNTFHIRCDKVVNAKQAPLEAKRLQLAAGTRELLRQKIAFYYGRVPDEDAALMGQ
jgi:hypothetical protein